MKYFSSLFAVIGIAILMVELSLFANQYDLAVRDFDTQRLMTAIEYAEEAAFAQSLQSGDVENSYVDSGAVTTDPTNVLDVFSSVMCVNYSMSLNTENKQRVLNSIDGAVLVNNDGYYMALLSEIRLPNGTEKKEIGDISYEFKWTPKLPFSYELTSPINAAISFDLHNADLTIYDKDREAVYWKRGAINKSLYYEDVRIEGKTYKIQRTKKTGIYAYNNSGGASVNFQESVVNDDIKYRVANDKIANALNYNIQKVTELRGGTTYNVHMPAYTTHDGINPVIGNSLIVIISNADYAKKANLTEAVMSGHRSTNKVYVVGFEEDGRKYYCRTGQLPMTASGGIPTLPNGAPKYITERKYLTETEAALAGYAPHYTYLQIPLDRD